MRLRNTRPVACRAPAFATKRVAGLRLASQIASSSIASFDRDKEQHTDGGGGLSRADPPLHQTSAVGATPIKSLVVDARGWKAARLSKPCLVQFQIVPGLTSRSRPISARE